MFNSIFIIFKILCGIVLLVFFTAMLIDLMKDDEEENNQDQIKFQEDLETLTKYKENEK